jgi:hypothetical protein
MAARGRKRSMATEKFKALVHFMVHECREHPGRLGAIRLNKALWYTDVVAYKMNGVPVTGETYVKRKHGPVPSHILATLRALQEEGKILIREPEHQYDPRKFLALASPEPAHLSDDERELARSILDLVCGYSANEISELTHDIIWNAAAEGEEIPMYATLAASRGEITNEVRAWASGLVQEIEQGAA